MVKLLVDDLEQITILEYLLYTRGIEYEIELNDGRYGIQAPHLLVYGAPLDEKRSIRWALHRLEEHYCE